MPIDRIYVPSPEISAKQYVQVEPGSWSEKINRVVTVTEKGLEKVKDAVPKTWVEVVRDTKDNVVSDVKRKVLNHIPGATTIRSLEDQYDMLNKGLAARILELYNGVLADFQRGVMESANPPEE